MSMRSTKDLKDIVSDIRGKSKNKGIAGDYDSTGAFEGDKENSKKSTWSHKFGSSTDVTQMTDSGDDKATISKL